MSLCLKGRVVPGTESSTARVDSDQWPGGDAHHYLSFLRLLPVRFAAQQETAKQRMWLQRPERSLPSADCIPYTNSVPNHRRIV
ncbi:hypothetical protein MSTO_16940 [Mycobacterium stomatepiae]|uniref:Uncharacterized protein n=1 Tax=Mycobacterium stomatepiae TaxID=470076 RepID=A0A7I7Q5G0_9MYCO|nr:hypothetical protein MSTO_16940 [Mycobacterium stomatepiae]